MKMQEGLMFGSAVGRRSDFDAFVALLMADRLEDEQLIDAVRFIKG